MYVQKCGLNEIFHEINKKPSWIQNGQETHLLLKKKKKNHSLDKCTTQDKNIMMA